MDSHNPCGTLFSNGNGVTTSASLSLVASPLPILDMFKGVTSESTIASLIPVAMKVCELYGSYIHVVGLDAGRSVESGSDRMLSSNSPVPVLPDTSFSSFSERSVSSNGSLNSRSKLRSSRRAAAWRRNNVVKSLPSGYCYAKCFLPRAVRSVTSELMEWPTVQSVLLQPSEIVHRPCMMDDYRLTRVADGKYHVVAPSESSDSAGGVNFVDALVGIARRYEYAVGTYGHLLRSVPRIGVLPGVSDLLVQGDLLGGVVDPGSQSVASRFGSGDLSRGLYTSMTATGKASMFNLAVLEGKDPLYVPGGVALRSKLFELGDPRVCGSWFFPGTVISLMYLPRRGHVRVGENRLPVNDVLQYLERYCSEFNVIPTITDVVSSFKRPNSLFWFVGCPEGVLKLWQTTNWPISRWTVEGCFFDVDFQF